MSRVSPRLARSRHAPRRPLRWRISCWSAWLTPPGPRSSFKTALARRGLLVPSARTYSGLEVGSIATGPGMAFETRGHVRFCVRTPGENDMLMAALNDLMRTEPSV